jgi:hypothetical protein
MECGVGDAFCGDLSGIEVEDCDFPFFGARVLQKVIT